MFKDICFSILHDITELKQTNKFDLLITHINNRLNESYNSYENDLNSSLDFLKRRDDLRLMRRLNKLN